MGIGHRVVCPYVYYIIEWGFCQGRVGVMRFENGFNAPDSSGTVYLSKPLIEKFKPTPPFVKKITYYYTIYFSTPATC